jgi:hypothetical protein
VSPNWIHVCTFLSTYTIQITSRAPAIIVFLRKFRETIGQNLESEPFISHPAEFIIPDKLHYFANFNGFCQCFALKRIFANHTQVVFHFVISEIIERPAVHDGNDGFLIVLTSFNGIVIFVKSYIFWDVTPCSLPQFYRCYGITY